MFEKKTGLSQNKASNSSQQKQEEINEESEVLIKYLSFISFAMLNEIYISNSYLSPEKNLHQCQIAKNPTVFETY